MDKKGENLWGGRFTGRPDPQFAEFNRSFGFDRRLLEFDIEASIAHCKGLISAGVLTKEEGEKLTAELGRIRDASREPAYIDSDKVEDVHSFIEAKLIETLGDLGKKLHTGRSRNDQVATAFRLWVRASLDKTLLLIKDVQNSLLDLADAHSKAVLPGYTHLQKAQPVLFAHWCLAYFEMFSRDRERITEARKRANVCPLGSGALAGTSYPIDREMVARSLGFEAISANSLDAVSDRDFAVEFASNASLIMMHLSRLAEDIIIYSSSEFGFLELSDAISTGSSLMPQKKNPDAMELVRGKSGRVFGHLQGLLTMLKGLPLAYNKDMQEDKEAVFDTTDTISGSLQVTATVLRNIRLREERTLDAASHGYMNATELADYLVKKGLPFRQAHDMVGRMVLAAIDSGVELQNMQLERMKSFCNLIEEDIYEALSLEKTISSKEVHGGTSITQVARALLAARKNL